MKTRVHFLGIAGSGASAAAELAKAQGFTVTGCDLSLEGHDPKHLKDVDILAITPAVISFDPKNTELVQAKKQGLEVLTWQAFVGKYLLEDKFVIAVTGTHGKSTTTAMIAKVLTDAKLDPSVLLGAVVPKWKNNYRVGKGKYFVIEADEAYDNFLNYFPDIAVVTNIEMDHPEYFKDFNSYQNSFEEFLLQTKKIILGNLSDPIVAEIFKDVMKKSSVTGFDYSKNQYDLNLKIPGQFNILNATAAFEVGLQLGINPEIIRNSLNNYSGIGRRFEFLGTYKGADIYTDFGHHPTEIKTTMEAAREKFPDQYIWLVYEPHMFSRTKGLFKEFVKTFTNLPVNQTILLDIYPSREADTGIVSSKQLADAVSKSNIDYVPEKDLRGILKTEVNQGDIIFFMGAGNIDQLAKSFAIKNATNV